VKEIRLDYAGHHDLASSVLDLLTYCLICFFSSKCWILCFILFLYVCIASKGCPWNDLYCVGWDVKPYSLTHSVWHAVMLLKKLGF